MTVPANLTPQYFKAEQAYKDAETVEQKIIAVEEMLAVIPKHKGTDHMQADLKRRLSKLRIQPKQKKAGSRPDPFHVERGGAGQALLFGAPNVGKSAIVAAVTRARVNVSEFPFATTTPVPGMTDYDGIHVQLVDLPPFTDDYMQPGMMGAVRGCDVLLIVVDLSAKDLLEQYEIAMGRLADRNIEPVSEPAAFGSVPELLPTKPSILLCNKCDLDPDGGNFEALKELSGCKLAMLPVSAKTGANLDAMAAEVVRLLDVVRVYSKLPHKPPDLGEPFVLRRGSTVLDMARAVHRDLPETLKFARIWGSEKFDGQNVQRDHVLADGDVIELNA